MNKLKTIAVLTMSMAALSTAFAAEQAVTESAQAAPVVQPQAGNVELDRIVAVVNNDVITDRELQERTHVVAINLRRQNIQLPPMEQLRAQGTEVYAYLSAKSEDDLFHQELFRTLGAVVRTTTAPNERITDAFAADAAQLPFDAAYSCGSNRLAAHMKQLPAQHGFPAYVSLEEHMACGVGACKGCTCTAHDKDSGEASYVRVCKSGPVFDVDRVL